MSHKIGGAGRRLGRPVAVVERLEPAADDGLVLLYRHGPSLRARIVASCRSERESGRALSQRTSDMPQTQGADGPSSRWVAPPIARCTLQPTARSGRSAEVGREVPDAELVS